MSARASLSLLIELRRRERDRVAGVAAQARREADNATATLRMLEGYLREYRQRAPKALLQPTEASSVRIHEHFVGKLDTAIDDQTQRAKALCEREIAQRAALSEEQRRLKALEVLEQRRESARRRRLEVAEQKQTDEFAAQAFARGRPRETRDE
jgi:flagellar FliJ protein